MNISKDDRHEFSKKRRKLVRKGLNPYDDKMLTNLDKEWVQLRTKVVSIKMVNFGNLELMNDFEDEHYYQLGVEDEAGKIRYELNRLRSSITEPVLMEEFNKIEAALIDDGDINYYLNLKRAVVKLQAKLGAPIHFYEALDEEYNEVFQKVMSDTFKIR